jgi:hypothetical protein
MLGNFLGNFPLCGHPNRKSSLRAAVVNPLPSENASFGTASNPLLQTHASAGTTRWRSTGCGYNRHCPLHFASKGCNCMGGGFGRGVRAPAGAWRRVLDGTGPKTGPATTMPPAGRWTHCGPHCHAPTQWQLSSGLTFAAVVASLRQLELPPGQRARGRPRRSTRLP